MIGFILFNDALAPMDMVIKLGMNILTRRYEFQAGKLQSAINLLSPQDKPPPRPSLARTNCVR
jgi:hypothetical protein